MPRERGGALQPIVADALRGDRVRQAVPVGRPGVGAELGDELVGDLGDDLSRSNASRSTLVQTSSIAVVDSSEAYATRVSRECRSPVAGRSPAQAGVRRGRWPRRRRTARRHNRCGAPDKSRTTIPCPCSIAPSVSSTSSRPATESRQSTGRRSPSARIVEANQRRAVSSSPNTASACSVMRSSTSSRSAGAPCTRPDASMPCITDDPSDDAWTSISPWPSGTAGSNTGSSERAPAPGRPGSPSPPPGPDGLAFTSSPDTRSISRATATGPSGWTTGRPINSPSRSMETPSRTRTRSSVPEPSPSATRRMRSLTSIPSTRGRRARSPPGRWAANRAASSAEAFIGTVLRGRRTGGGQRRSGGGSTGLGTFPDALRRAPDRPPPSSPTCGPSPPPAATPRSASCPIRCSRA